MNGAEKRTPLVDVLTTVLNDLDGALAELRHPGQEASGRREVEGAVERLRIVWRGLRAAILDDATTVQAASDVVTEIATDRARVREQRDRALDLAEALSNCDDGTERARLRGELARLRRVVAGSAETETGTDPEHPLEGR